MLDCFSRVAFFREGTVHNEIGPNPLLSIWRQNAWSIHSYQWLFWVCTDSLKYTTVDYSDTDSKNCPINIFIKDNGKEKTSDNEQIPFTSNNILDL